MELFEDGKNFTYAKLDLDGDGVEELITGNIYTTRICALHTVVDGQMVTCRDIPGVESLCQDGILEYVEAPESGREYRAYYQYHQGGSATVIEALWRDSPQGAWHWDPDGDGPEEDKTITNEEAEKIMGSYSRIDLDMKPFSQYPLK